MENEFLITVITVAFNAEKEIEETVSSVLGQVFCPFEYVIVDGDSTDNTNVIIKRLIEERQNKSISVRYISEKDSGIYNAMNKAVRMSRGKYLLHINNGDVLFDSNTLKKAADCIINYLDKTIIYGDAISEWYGLYKMRQDKYLEQLTQCMSVSHQAIFIRRSELLAHPYNEKYAICADYHFVLERFLNGGGFQYIPVTISINKFGGVSTSCFTETAIETLDLRRSLGVISEQEYDSEMEKLRLASGERKEPLKELIRKLVPLKLRKIRAEKKRIRWLENSGWKESIQACEKLDHNNNSIVDRSTVV